MKGMQTRLAVVFLFAAFAAAAAAAPAPRPTVDRFDEREAFAFLKRQVALGPRPAGSPASRRLAAILRATVPRGRYQPVPDGLRNVVATVPGRSPSRLVVVGAHYDTYDLRGFVGANDSASGTAVVRQLARTIKPRTVRPTLVFVFFDGEEAPPNTDFDREGLRGSTVAARVFKRAESMVLLDFVGDRNLAIPREANSNGRLWARLRAAATRVGAGRVFPPGTGPSVTDDHIPFQQIGVPAIDLIDFDFPCWHRRCDNLSIVSVRSLDAVGETMVEFLRSL
jgi:glutaminyl-peptide cyclotransferase